MKSRPLWATQNDLAEKVRLGPIVKELGEYADDIAERAVELGSTALGTVRVAAGTSRLGDADTADLFTEVSRGIDKLLWKVEAHEQAKD